MRTALFLFALTTQLPATPLIINGDLADNFVGRNNPNTAFIGQNQGINGQNGGITDPFYHYAMVYVFQLPTLAPNQTITSAQFSPYLTSSSPRFDTDLYGLAYRSLPTVLATDWFAGPSDPNNTLLQASFITPNLPAGRVFTSPAGNTALLTFINAQYANGAQGGEYIFLRLSSQDATSLNGFVNFYYAADIVPFMVANVNGSTAARWQGQFGPLLTLNVEETASPEPITFLSVGLGLCAVAFLRRPKR